MSASVPSPGAPQTILIILTAVLCVICMGGGIIIGYFLHPESCNALPGTYGVQRWNLERFGNTANGVPATLIQCENQINNIEPETQSYLENCQVEACQAELCDLPIPRSYIAYHLGGETITIDGKLTDRAWQDVSWTEPFVDIRGEDYAIPPLLTRAKIRWNDEFLFVGGYIQDRDIWANKTLHDTTVYQDNAFQVLLDTEGSNHKYKEIVINALGTISDTMLSRPYLDDGEPLFLWESRLLRAVHVEGSLNDPTSQDSFWSVEMAIPFSDLIGGTEKSNDPPKDREVWNFNFARSHYKVEVVDDKYHKILDKAADWWVWNTPAEINIHIPDRWGLVQFRRQKVNSTTFVKDPYWEVTSALRDIYKAEHSYRAVTGRYTERVDKLNLPPYISSGRCFESPYIKVDWSGFTATVRPNDRDLKDGHIRTDRYLWFGNTRIR
ncbi:uncharacterized protein LOC135467150 [Liolophura sinensis]|uniref:uncharacterized protein LOC135467150 n=1 Tax=Liolophura sinensis TaxID=3198878 RepID=UPI0031589D18